MDRSGASSGKGLGRVLGGVWRLWEPLRLFFGVIFSCFYLGWSSKGLLEASGLDFDWILGGLEGFWEGLERVLGGILEGSGQFRAMLGIIGTLLLVLAFASYCLLLLAISCLLLLSWS